MILRRILLAGAVCAAAVGFGTTGALAANERLFAVLDGGNEVPDPPGGDLDAYGSASLVFRGTVQICYSIIISGTDTPTLAHIHRGSGSDAGPVVVPLNPPAGGSLGLRAACVNTTPALHAEIQANPSAFYINVHTGAFGGGALRGQLF